MIVKLYSVRDKLMDFGGPIAFKEEKVAKRWFTQLLAQKKDNYEKPEDYELYEIGAFETENGTIQGSSVTEVKLIMKGEDLNV